MRRIFYLFIFAALSLASSVPLYAQTEQYTMPKKDGVQGDKTVSGELLFYDMGGPDGATVQSYAGYTRFLPEDEAGQIQISFNSMDLSGNAAVYIYDGDINFSGYWAAIPEGYLAKLTGNDKGGTYTSTTGSLSVLYHCKGAGSGAGWEALVSEVPSKTQEWKEISASADNLGTAYPGKQGQPLICVNALTDGGADPMQLSKLSFTLGGTLPLEYLSNLRVVYSKGSASPSGEAFGATADAAGAISFDGNAALKSGNNYFWLIADIADNAPAGMSVNAALSGATVAGTERVASPIAPAEGVTLANMVLFPAEAKTYQVGENPINFYDDGGIDGKISLNFTGQVTFTPTTPGKKVRVRFTDLKLFNTSTVGKNDLLKVYNGTTVDDAQLLATVLKEPVTIHSTSADGALTITLVSTTGIAADGFEAVVEEFTPVPMTIEELSASHPSTATAAAGEADVQILLIDAKTHNTEPALTLQGMNFTSTSTAPLTSASLYTLGNDAASAGELIGTISNPGAEFSITFTEPLTLREHDNYFLLAYELGRDAANGQTIDAALTGVKTADATIAATAGDPEGGRTVNNVYYSRTTHATYTVNGSWQFLNSPSEYSYYAYDKTNGDQITTFLPATPGMTIELDFSKFDIQSSNSYYSTPASFKIYDGADTSGRLLWEMTYDTRAEGPGKALRAANTDGALTVVFNSGDNTGGIGKGFEATVREYKSHPMELNAVEAFQNNTDAIRPGATDQEIIGIRLNAEGDLQPLSLSQVTVDLKGCQDILTNLKLYSTGSSAEFSTGTLVAESSVNAQQGAQTLTLSNPAALNEKDNYFWLACDMAEAFPSDRAVDASLISVVTGSATHQATVADPEGERLTKNIYYFEGGDKTVKVDDSLLFYDNMGPDAKYTTDASGTVTFVPGEGKIIRFIFKNFYTNVRDYFYIYDGSKAEGTELLKLSSSKSDLAPVVSTADDGALTVKFEPAYPYNDGWEIEVQAFVPQPLEVRNVSVTPVNDLKMLRGSADNKMLKVAVEIGGDKGTVNLTALDFDALQTDLASMKAAKVWYTAESETFGTYNQYGSALDATPLHFEGNVEYKLPGTYYYWLTYDITGAAAIDSPLQARLASVTANEANHTPAEVRDALVTVREGMHGTYTIGTSGEEDYRSIGEAVTAMNEGIDGPVEFLISDGNYKELVSVPQITGASELNTVTMRSASGKRDNVVITYDTYVDPGSSGYANRYGVFTFDGADWFTLKDVTVQTEQVRFPGVVYLRNQSRHVTVDNCVVRAPKSNAAGTGTTLVYMYALNEANCNSDWFTLQNSLIDGGLIGVNLGGTSYVALPTQKGGRILNNTFINQGSKAVYVSCEQDFLIEGNTAIGNGEGCTSSYWAFDISMGHGNCDIRNNVIRITDPISAAHGFYLRTNTAEFMKEGYHRVYNNEVNISGISSAVTGMRINNDMPNLEIAHNTFRMRGNNANSNGIYFSGTIENGIFANNIVQNEAGGTVYGVNRQTYLDNINMRGNVCWTEGEAFAYVSQNRTFDEWKEIALNDEAPVLEQTSFLSDEILEPAEEGSLRNGSAVAFADTDIYGASRDAEHPTAGAYEYAEATDAPAMAEGKPSFRDITHVSAVMDVTTTLTATAHYYVAESSAEAPTQEQVMDEDLAVECRRGVSTAIALEGLKPNTEYVVYSVLESLRGVKSDVLASVPFETTFIPTTVATFENASVDDNENLIDGTFSFTGFSLSTISDGVGDEPNVKAASMDDEYAVVRLTNANDLPLEGFFIKNSAEATITAKSAELKTTGTKTLPAYDSWTYIDLRDMGEMTYLELETEGELSIDNFGGDPLPLAMSISFDAAQSINEGDNVSLPIEIEGGVLPYTIEWTDAARNTVGSENPLPLTAVRSAAYTATVTDARGTVCSDAVTLRVLGQQYPATFDDLYLEPESNWHGNIDDEDYMQGSFFSGSFEFNNLYMSDWDSWAFFGYSNMTSTDFENYYTDQYKSAVGSGVEESANYGVAFISDYMGNTEITLSNTESGEPVEGCWFTNSAWVVDAIENGDGMSDRFDKDDKLTLTVTGLHADGSTSALDFILADYTADEEQERWYLDTWQWCDLKPLGDVVKLRFSMSSTKQNSYGMTTPAYVCLDNLGTGRKVTEADQVTLLVNEDVPADSFELGQFFSFDEQEGNVAYSLECKDERVTLKGSTVSISAPAGEQLSMIAHATQRGKHEYVSIPVSMGSRPLGLDAVSVSRSAIYPNPARDYVNVSTDAADYNVSIISLDGRTLLHLEGMNGKTRIDLNGITPGQYLLRLATENGDTTTHKLIVR